MIDSAYRALQAVADKPIEAWEAIRDQVTDPKEREHIEIAIKARRKMEAERTT